jgi:hypothetical protein
MMPEQKKKNDDLHYKMSVTDSDRDEIILLVLGVIFLVLAFIWLSV